MDNQRNQYHQKALRNAIIVRFLDSVEAEPPKYTLEDDARL
jgi:hypothetical protein